MEQPGKRINTAQDELCRTCLGVKVMGITVADSVELQVLAWRSFAWFMSEPDHMVVPHRGDKPQVYFLRTATGTDVDILVESGRQSHPHRSQALGNPETLSIHSGKTWEKRLRQGT